MKRETEKLGEGQYDLLVIGSGINGAAVANLASQQGLKVVVLEKDDFAQGASSKSTKLLHGGLRYLEHLAFGMVYESLKERSIQMKKAAHLVKPLEFIIPVYKKDRRSLWFVRLGVCIYDILSGKNIICKGKSLSSEDIVKDVPDLMQEGLLGGVGYYDAQMDDARLCLENVLQAELQGAHIANYVEVKSLIKDNGKTGAVRAYDKIKKEYLTISAKNIVCSVGPWTNQFLSKEKSGLPDKIRITKGIHIVYREQFSKKALLMSTKKDKRVFFIIPWKGNTLIGTTDTDYDGDLDNIDISVKDIDYLAQEFNRFFPKRRFKEENVITSFAGIRPLVWQGGDPSNISRECIIDKSPSGIFYILGGKYTNYRKIAEDCLNKIFGERVNIDEEDFKVFGSGKVTEDLTVIANSYDLSEDIIESLVNMYGGRYKDVLALIDDDSFLKDKLEENHSFIKAQVVYARDIEMAYSVEDVVCRRFGIYDKDWCREDIKNILSKGDG